MATTFETPKTTKFPSGMVLGPDGKPCKVCTGFKAWSGATKKKATTAPIAQAAAVPIAAGIIATADTSSELPKDCPADVERLGRHTWTFLHTTASYYPLLPSATQKSSMLGLLNSLPVLYPCSHCADELGTYMKDNPPVKAVEARSTLEKWLCEVHNEVNERLGKEQFPCETAGERWRDGPKSGRCD